jgi:nicotinamide-nucleotide amidase
MKDNLEKNISLLAQELIGKLSKENLEISFAESMTGGMLASSLTKEPHASKVFGLGIVTYSETMKINLLNCKEETIMNEGVYSEETVLEMIDGLKNLSNAEVLVAVSGIAGPDFPKNHEVGEVYIAIAFNEHNRLYNKRFFGDRETIRLKTVEFCFAEVLKFLK